MARAGRCSVCGTDVWLTDSGGCPAGHGPECIGDAREVPDPPAVSAPSVAPEGSAAATAPAKKSNKRILVIAAVVVAALALAFGLMAVLGVFTSTEAKTEAQAHKALRGQTLSNGQTLDSLVKAIGVSTKGGLAVTINLNKSPVELGALGGSSDETTSIMNIAHAMEDAVMNAMPDVTGVAIVDGGVVIDAKAR
jgi:hypothetical protein